eukprot:1255292-Prymnesium_polylepis.2
MPSTPGAADCDGCTAAPPARPASTRPPAWTSSRLYACFCADSHRCTRSATSANCSGERRSHAGQSMAQR